MLISPYVTLTYENSRGMSMTLTPFGDYGLVSVADSLENEINSEKQGNLDGETFISSSLAVRHLEIFGVFNTATGATAMKRQLERVFNLTLPGVLTYQNTATGIKRSLECRVESLPEVRLNGMDVTFAITLSALGALWKGAGQGGSVSVVNKRGRFPLVIPPQKFVFGYRANTLVNIIDNVGDAAAGVTIRLRARNGTVTNPWVAHSDSESVIKVIYPMLAGDEIVIVSTPSQAAVTVNGMDGMKYLTDETARKFFTLYVGENVIGYGADENVANLDVLYASDELYLGVG